MKKSSQKRIEANRRNAQKSTGPRTAEGKAKSAANATTHGLSSLNRNPLGPGCFLKMEDENEYKGLLEEYVTTYQPQHRDELDLLSEAVYAKWRQQRVWAAETAQLEIAIARNERELQRDLPLANASIHLANGFAHSADMMRLYLRYDAQFHRHYKSCLTQLQDLQASRSPEPDSPIEPTQPEPNPTSEQEVLAPSEAIEPIQAASNPSPSEAIETESNPERENGASSPQTKPKSDAQLFEEYRDRLLQRAIHNPGRESATSSSPQNKISENKPGDLVGTN